MGKENLVRSKPHVNASDDGEPDLGSQPATSGEPEPTESVSFSFEKIRVAYLEEPVEPGDLHAPPMPASELPAVGAAQTITVGGMQSATGSGLPDGSMPYESLTLSAEDAAGFQPDGTPLRAKVDPTASPHDTHEIEEVSLTYQKIELEPTSRPAPAGDGTTEQFFTISISEGHDDPDGPSTLASLQPQEPGAPGSLDAETEHEEITISMLVPAVQKLNDEPGDPDDLELDL